VGVGQAEAGIGLGAVLEAGGRIAGIEFEGLVAVFAAIGDVQRRSQADIEFPADIERIGPFAIIEIAGAEDMRQRVPGRLVERDIEAADIADILIVGAIARAQIPVPAAELAFDADRLRVVVLGDGLGRLEAEWVGIGQGCPGGIQRQPGRLGFGAIILEGLGMPV